MDTATKEGKYIYCVIDSDKQLSLGPLGIGGRGDQLHTICFNGIAALVSDAPLGRYRVSRENSIAHEKAIETAMAQYTVLPVRFATVAEDEDKVKRILEKEHDRFKDLLGSIAGKTEISLKAIFKEGIVYKDILEKYEDIRVLKVKIAALAPEKSHNQRREIGRMVEEALQREKEIVREDILDTLSPLAAEVKTNDTYGELMIINAAFFVEKEKEPDFDQQVQILDEKYSQEVTFNYVGPLPPFNFVNISINTEDY
ncbi:MAG: gas vesicle synthesis GvpLGvpF [Planctomycetes bacterium HGW-Planctomycetes-1]|nr:MAG: gas vesicle synthesis GvpLGvpF [Planctomycetes bacterium HGW-Planctomycetes-1]